MRRYIVIFTFIFIVFMVTVSSAQEETPPEAERPLLVTIPPALTIATDNATAEITLEPIAEADLPFRPHAPQADPPSDSCQTATSISIPGGGSADVKSFTNDFGQDPLLTCMWGSPTNTRGYRTAWYQFKPDRNGSVTISTLGSNFDTVLAIYTGDCEVALTAVACNDDAAGFTSALSLAVQKDVTYYIEVADWQSGVAEGTATLWLNITKNPFNSAWDLQAGQMPQPTSRHATAVVGANIYVIGGQTELGVPTARTYRFNTLTGLWTQLESMPGQTGYSNTTAVHLGGKIYLPSGYTNPTIDGTHQVYDIARNSWAWQAGDLPQPVPWADGRPVIFGQAVAHPNGGGYFLTGGINHDPQDSDNLDDNSTRANVYFYSVSANSWSAQPDMTYPRYGHVADWVNGRLCVAGGLKFEAGTGLILHGNAECFNGGSWSSIGSLRIPRYNAGSAVGADGRWYVFGGITVDSRGVVPAQSTEVYDPATNSWSILPVHYDLGGYDNTLTSFPFREWPGGGRVGNYIWAIGGNVPVNGIALGYVEKLSVLNYQNYLPTISRDFVAKDGKTLNSAWTLGRNVPQIRGYTDSRDFYHMYTFTIAAQRTVKISLTNLPADSDLDMYLYSPNKLLLGRDPQVGNNNEVIEKSLPIGRYYILIKRTTPPQALLEPIYYQIEQQ